MEKIPTGVPGLDQMLKGGLIKGRPYLIAGGPGAGKTIMAMQFLMEGVRNKERGLYIALEEQAPELIEDMAQFGWNLRNIKIIDTAQEPEADTWSIRADSVVSKPALTLANLVNIIQDRLKNYGAKRIVIDSLTSIKMLYEHKISARREILSLTNFLTRSNSTSIITIEQMNGNETLMEEFLAAGVIRIHTIEKEGEYISAISIEKIRGSSFDKHIRPMKITDKGIKVFPTETLFG